MWTQVTNPVTEGALRERASLSRDLGALCGLPGGAGADECTGQADCVFFDDERQRCGLLLWDVPFKVGPEGLRWFAAHRTVDPRAADPTDEALMARCISL